MSPKKAAKKKKLTYAAAGVDIEEGDALVDRLAKVNPHIGGFSGAFPLDVRGMKRPVLLASTDGVGTKLLVAQKMKKLDTIGIDLVAMVVNDLIVCGARPLFFLDYYATGKLTAKESSAILDGIVNGCREADVPLLGGETAEMPGLYSPGDFDLAGFGVGIADKTKLVDGAKVKPGDAIVGIASSGVHSNGYSLVRAIVKEAKLKLDKKPKGLDEKLGDALLRPTRIYVRTIAKLTKHVAPLAMAHITGGGLPGNVERVLPTGCVAKIDSSAWPEPPLFKLLQDAGNVDRDEMFRVFNMGIGYVIVVPKSKVATTLSVLDDCGERAWQIGEIAKGRRRVKID